MWQAALLLARMHSVHHSHAFAKWSLVYIYCTAQVACVAREAGVAPAWHSPQNELALSQSSQSGWSLFPCQRSSDAGQSPASDLFFAYSVEAIPDGCITLRSSGRSEMVHKLQQTPVPLVLWRSWRRCCCAQVPVVDQPLALKPLPGVLLAGCLLYRELVEGLGLHIALPDQGAALCMALPCNNTTRISLHMLTSHLPGALSTKSRQLDSLSRAICELARFARCR